MKRLLIVRHAQATHKPGYEDYDRPLTKRGRKEAPQIGGWLVRTELVPKLIVSSPAVRAIATAALLASSSRFEGTLSVSRKLYQSSAEQHASVLRATPAEIAQLALVGHNPTLEDLVKALTGKEESLATGGVAAVDLPVDDWSVVQLDGRATLVELWRPSA